MRVIYVAGDGGPRAALASIATRLPGPSVTCSDGSTTHWPTVFEQTASDLVICGASDSPGGRRLETAARQAALRAGLKVAIIEDFPCNYFPVERARTDLLVVESEAAADLTRQRWGGDVPPLEVIPAVRYDPLRGRLASLRAARPTDADSYRVLWAGQPETEDCLCTLEALAPAMLAAGAKLLLKAHPRDAGHGAGTYETFLGRRGLPFEDVSAASVDEVMALRPRLVVTQFSSVAVEAGFHGIPALHVLLPGAGGARLLEKKGYSVLPWCAVGAAWHTNNPTQIKGLLHEALNDEARRAAIIHAFDRYFAVTAESAPKLIARLARL